MWHSSIHCRHDRQARPKDALHRGFGCHQVTLEVGSLCSSVTPSIALSVLDFSWSTISDLVVRQSLGKPRSGSASKILKNILTDTRLTRPAAKRCCCGGVRTAVVRSAATQHGSTSTGGKGPPVVLRGSQASDGPSVTSPLSLIGDRPADRLSTNPVDIWEWNSSAVPSP